MKVVAYLTHPLGPSLSYFDSSRRDNIANATSWVRWMMNHTDWAVNAIWLTYILAAEDINIQRHFLDQMANMERCDVLVLCGGMITPHMKVECEFARKCKMPIVDMPPQSYRIPGDRPPGNDNSWTVWMTKQASLPIARLIVR